MSAELSSSERVLWSGSPVRYPLFDRQDAYLVPFGTLWCGFAIFWETTAVKSGAPIFFVIWGVPFVLFGLYVSVGRLIMRQVMLRSVVYIVTDRRVIIRSNGRREQSRYLDHLEPPVLTESPDGVGTIRFGSTSPFQLTYHRTQYRWVQNQFVLYAIPYARFVCDLIVNTRR